MSTEIHFYVPTCSCGVNSDGGGGWVADMPVACNVVMPHVYKTKRPKTFCGPDHNVDELKSLHL
ncbi:unnamed protein product [Ceratitis capitata]|uniref:(Mediterranean fruit fly) hypothetical protein n=1 Tax=Ceratitis capitata TaxID=7213 RepID=A0A811UJ14_CERCA|nr:unnamed protein product [Ceratitis capitata]